MRMGRKRRLSHILQELLVPLFVARRFGTGQRIDGGCIAGTRRRFRRCGFVKVLEGACGTQTPFSRYELIAPKRSLKSVVLNYIINIIYILERGPTKNVAEKLSDGRSRVYALSSRSSRSLSVFVGAAFGSLVLSDDILEWENMGAM